MTRLIISLLLVLSTASECNAQIVNVETRWQACQNGRCCIVTSYGTGTVIGKTDSGKTIILGCKHQFDQPNGYASVKYDSVIIGGKKANIWRLSPTHDLSLMWSDHDLGDSLPLSECDAEIGQELSIQGYDKGAANVTGRPGKLTPSGLTAIPVEGNSGGPIIDRNNVVYGVTVGYAPAERPEKAVYVCATDVCGFVRSVVPFGWVMWAPPVQHGQQPSPQRGIVAIPPVQSDSRLVDLQREIEVLKERIRTIETAPSTPPSEHVIGAPGRDGKDATDAQVQRVVAAWIAKNIEALRGKDGLAGDPGPAGPSGKVDVVVKWSDGTPINSFKSVSDGSRVVVELDRTTVTKKEVQ